MSKPVLDPAAQAFADATANPPFLYGMPPREGRTAMRDVQQPQILVPGTVGQEVAGLTIYRPEHSDAALPVVLYAHGDWVFGDEHSDGRLARELALKAGVAVAFVHYSLAPEARYPVALEECLGALDWIRKHGAGLGLDASRTAVAGGNLAAALALRAGGLLAGQVLLCPATDAACATRSHREFAEGYFLRADGMRWCWDQYLPDEDVGAESTASPLRATRRELAGLPPTLVITAEADVLRDEGEAYAVRLRSAGVPVAAVRYQGVIHGFLTLNALRGTHSAQEAIDQAGRFLARALGTGRN
ncbi:alpha/beta hydrolase [Nonomuraea sp. PA05]|uniref:alpha/beta hydrolase n=1 Tax=Nonomuraea sp. PA05 TaxID=2604466 RepID=UPI0011D6F034|nr:alpha/beta hydrolase [Nonomuraea sp. PA05]TYB70247.1 alpha/beta hydrolase [Nonomuraea sp. PA05]